MTKNYKIVISASIFLNIVLILIVIWSVNQVSYVTDRTLTTNVINKLFGLHETISKQENENWSNLALVSKQLEDIGWGTTHTFNTGVTSKTINKDDSEMLLNLGSYFIRYSYSIDNPETPAESLKDMKLDLIRLKTVLTEQGFDNEEVFNGWAKQKSLKKLRNIVSDMELK